MGSSVTAPAGRHVRVSDLRGAARLAIDATIGLTDLVETMQHGVMRVPGARATPMGERATGMSGVLYRTIRGATLLLGGGIDAVLAQLAPKLAQVASSRQWIGYRMRHLGLLGRPEVYAHIRRWLA